jgi:glyoxylase-like metal-dependent hydrolase (beta-lactamase superfamily II)
MIKKIGLLAFAFIVSSPLAFASTPFAKIQAPGFYRTMIGDYEITVLLDGFFPMKPNEVVKDPASGKINELLLTSFEPTDMIPTSVNGFLINTGSKLILIDSGCGGFFGPSFGQLMGNLKASGYSPEQVDEVEITHMHTDHLGGVVTADGKAAFPQATLRMDQKDADFWLKSENAKNAPDQVKEMVANAIKAVAPYQAAGQFKPFPGSTEIAPGIHAISAYGHTPGHTAYSIESKGQKLLLVGDLIHIEALQFPDPGISMKFDSDTGKALTERKKLLADAAKNRYFFGAAHLPFPGIGHVQASKPGYRYIPIDYAPVK